MKAIQTKNLTIANIAKRLSDFGFSTSDLERMESATFSTKADLLVTYDGKNLPTISPEFGLYIPSGTLFSLTGKSNLEDLEMIRAGANSSLVTVTLEYGL